MSGLATRRQFSKIHRMLGFHPVTHICARFLRAWVLGLGWALLAQAAGRTDLRWHWSSPLPFGNNIADIIGDTNRFYLAVTDHGQAYQSDDLTQWKSLTTGTRNYLRAATFHPLGADTHAVIIVGEAGTVLRLHATGEFSRTTLPTSDWLEGVASSGTRLVAIGDQSALYTSDDGTNWLRRSSGVSAWWRSTTWRSRPNSGMFVVVGENGQIITSTDGINWTRRTSGTSVHLNRVIATPSGFLAVGDAGVVLISTDGLRWNSTVSGATDDLFAAATESRVVFGQTITVPLVAGARELRSAISIGNNYLWTDELDTRRTSPAPYSSYYAALHDGTQHVVGGQAGLIAVGRRSTSLDQSLLWNTYESPPRVILRDLTTAVSIGTNLSPALINSDLVVSTNRTTNLLYSAVGYGPTLLHSDNGITWSTALITAGASNTVFLGVGGRPNVLVTVGSGGRIARSPEAFEPLISTNSFTNAGVPLSIVLTNQINTLGLVWFDAPSGATQDLQGIAANSTLFVATGAQGTVLTSPDALTWTRQSTPTPRFISSVAAGPSQWVAVGEAGTIWTSSDARTWIPQSSGTDHWLWRVRHLNSRYVAAGQSGTLLTSLDGIVWTPSSTGITNWLYDVAAVDGTYYAVGSQGVTLTSTDAVTWQTADRITAKTLYGLATLRGQLITVGSEGAILRTQAGAFPNPPSLTQWPANPTEQLFLVQGSIDQRIRLERSPDLQVWTAEGELEITAVDGSLLFLSPITNAVDHLFFRAAERD